MREFVPPNAKTLPPQATRVFTGKIFDVYQWPQQLYDGTMTTFEMLRRPDTVEVIGIDGDKIILTRQIQPHQDWFYAYPGGRVEPSDKNELWAARREMREETGLEFQELKLVSVHQPQPKIDWLVYIFVANNVTRRGDLQPDAGEKIEVLKISLPKLKELAKQPNAKFLLPDFMKDIQTIDELKTATAVHQYSD